MSSYGSAVYGIDSYGDTYIRGTAAGRAIRFEPRLYTATKTNRILEDWTENMISGSVTLDLDLDGSKMTFTAEMRKPVTVQPLMTYVAPFLRITYEDGTYDDEQVGLFVLIPSTAHHYPGASTTELDGRDFCWLLDANQTPITVNDGASSDPISRVKQSLSSVGMTRHSLPLSGQVTNKVTSWGPGTSRLQRDNDRLQSVGYYNLWFDRHGVPTSRPYGDLATAQPAVTYSSDTGSRIVPPIDDAPDMTRLCNRAVVLGTDPTSAPIVAIRENNDPTSPVSFQNMDNCWITRTVEDPNIQTQAAANALADELVRNGASYYRTLTLQTLPDPTRNPREVYRLDVTTDEGTVIDGLWWCSGWTINLDWTQPVMTHTLNRVEPLKVTTP